MSKIGEVVFATFDYARKSNGLMSKNLVSYFHLPAINIGAPDRSTGIL
ncbi:hypothetical protein [Prevotella sp. P2-180]|nr:hypothetical protein [Prevotella sp. P2-180]